MKYWYVNEPEDILEALHHNFQSSTKKKLTTLYNLEPTSAVTIFFSFGNERMVDAIAMLVVPMAIKDSNPIRSRMEDCANQHGNKVRIAKFTLHL